VTSSVTGSALGAPAAAPSAAAGACSSTACTLVPVMPQLLTPARRGDAASPGQGRAWALTYTGPLKSISGFGVVKFTAG
jgi:hypothetical protein